MNSIAWMSDRDQVFLQQHQPRLTYKKCDNKLSGLLCFTAEVNKIKLRGRYQIEVDFSKCTPLPIVKEIGGRIKKLAKKKNKKLIDLHVNKNEGMNLCLCSRLKEFEKAECYKAAQNPTQLFICDLVIPFFYSIRYFQQHGIFPFGELPHGPQGLVEHCLAEPRLFQKHTKAYHNMHPKEFDTLIQASNGRIKNPHDN